MSYQITTKCFLFYVDLIKLLFNALFIMLIKKLVCFSQRQFVFDYEINYFEKIALGINQNCIFCSLCFFFLQLCVRNRNRENLQKEPVPCKFFFVNSCKRFISVNLHETTIFKFTNFWNLLYGFISNYKRCVGINHNVYC